MPLASQIVSITLCAVVEKGERSTTPTIVSPWVFDWIPRANVQNASQFILTPQQHDRCVNDSIISCQHIIHLGYPTFVLQYSKKDKEIQYPMVMLHNSTATYFCFVS